MLRILTLLGLGLPLMMSEAFGGHLSDELLVSAKLTGDQHSPPITTSAVGVASFTINSTWDTIFVNIAANGLSGDITGIHVHDGAMGQSGGVVTDLTGWVEGNRVVGALTGDDVSSDKIANYLTGGYYLNLHTAANPGGELRGQLNLETDWGFRATLDTAQHTHTVTNNAWGVGYFNLSHDQKWLNIGVAMDSLSGPITAAHLHYGATGTTGGVALDLSSMINGNTIVGSIDASTPSDLITEMLAGDIYINVHTAANGPGELRGQVWLDNDLAFDSWLSTDQHVTPPAGATGSGAAFLSLSPMLDSLWYDVQVQDLTGAISSAHIHDGAAGSEGGVLVDMSANINGNRISGWVTGASLTSDLISKLLKGETYFNIHTTANPAGELRGQVYRLAREGYSLSFEGNQEVPKEFSLAKGAGIVSVDRDQSNAHYMMVVSDLSGPITGAHFHNAAMGQSGAVLFDLSGSFDMTSGDDAAFGYWTSDDDSMFSSTSSQEFRDDMVYVNLHTAFKPNGEVRGQVLRGATEFWHQSISNGSSPTDPMYNGQVVFSALCEGDQFDPAVAGPGIGVGGFLLNDTRDTIWINMTFDSLSGPISMIHIHEGEAGTSGPVVHDLSSFVNKNRVKGWIAGFDLNKFVTGQYYINCHTDANPAGEVRGQINLETEWMFRADINAAQTVPLVSATGYGQGVFNLSADQTKLDFKVALTGLTGTVTGAHLHLGAPGAGGGVVADLGSYMWDNAIVGTIDPTAFIVDLMDGNIYLNIHTDANPAGEIRGQLDLANTFTFDSWINGNQAGEETPGYGVGSFWFNSSWDTLWYDIVVDQISGPITGIHIHNGGLGQSGGVDIDLSAGVSGNRIMGSITGNDLSGMNIDHLMWGMSYINVHTDAFAAGEIRGQVYRLAHDGFAFDACGEQHDPMVSTTGYGGGVYAVDRNHWAAHFMFANTELSGPITGAHIHDGQRGAGGGVLYDVSTSMWGNAGWSYIALDSAGAAKIVTGGAYLNIHTDQNPAGEIRGQIDNMMDCATPGIATGIKNYVSHALEVYPNPVGDVIFVQIPDQAEVLSLVVRNMMGEVVEQIDVESRDEDLTVDLSHAPSGMYMVELKTVEGSISGRIVKQ